MKTKDEILSTMAGTTIVELIETLKADGMNSDEATLYAEVLFDEFHGKIERVT